MCFSYYCKDTCYYSDIKCWYVFFDSFLACIGVGTLYPVLYQYFLKKYFFTIKQFIWTCWFCASCCSRRCDNQQNNYCCFGEGSDLLMRGLWGDAYGQKRWEHLQEKRRPLGRAVFRFVPEQGSSGGRVLYIHKIKYGYYEFLKPY